MSIETSPFLDRSPTHAGLDWNYMPHQNRTDALGQWYGTDPSNVLPGDVIPEAIENFWERGWVEDMPTFADTLERSKAHPEEFSRTIFYKPKALACPIEPKYYFALHTNPQMSESATLIDLDKFLFDVKETAENANDPEQVEAVTNFREQLGYLSERDFEKGVGVIAEAWIEYLEQNPSKNLNVYVQGEDKGPVKSNHYVLEKVFSSIIDRTSSWTNEAQAALLDKINANSDRWVDDAKMIIIDDWAISGGSCEYYVEAAKKVAKEKGVSFSDDNVEAHVIAMSKATEKPDGFKYRSVFLHQPDNNPSYREVSMLGAHCTVNYGYEHQIINMQKYLAEHGLVREAPHFFKIQASEYRSGILQETGKRTEDVAVIVQANKEALRILATLSKLENSTADADEVDELNGYGKQVDEQHLLSAGALRILLEHHRRERNALRKRLAMPKGI